MKRILMYFLAVCFIIAFWNIGVIASDVSDAKSTEDERVSNVINSFFTCVYGLDSNYTAEQRLQYLKEKYLTTQTDIDSEMDQIEAENMVFDSSMVSNRSSITYDRTTAVNYATTYYSSYNSSFGSFSGDCQNFASQCVWAGYGGTNVPALASSATSPMVYYYNSSNARDWFHAKGVNSVSTTLSWTSASNFMAYIANSSTSVRGPMGWIYDRTNVCLKYAMPGDIIQVYWENGIDYPSDLPDHAYIVVSVDNAYGYNNVSTIKVAAHTTNCYNYSLSSLGYSENEFALIRIASWQSGS